MRKYLLLFSLIILLTAGGYFFFKQSSFFKPQLPKYIGPVEKITVGIPKLGPELSLPFYVAQERGYFRDNGLEVLLEPILTSVQIDQAILEKKIDIGYITDYTFVVDSFKQADLQILASIGQAQNIAMIVRTDKGIRQPGDLKGKRIGIVPKTALEFFLDSFLLFNHLSPQDVKIIPLPGSQLKQALVEGKVDAIMFSKRVGLELTRELKDKILYWPAQQGQSLYSMVITHKDALPKHREAFERFLDALIKVETYIKTNSADALAIAQKYLSPSDHEYLVSDFKSYEFKIALDQAMVIFMGDQARWMIENKLTPKIKVPNYLDYIYFDALEAVKPEAVTITH